MLFLNWLTLTKLFWTPLEALRCYDRSWLVLFLNFFNYYYFFCTIFLSFSSWDWKDLLTLSNLLLATSLIKKQRVIRFKVPSPKYFWTFFLKSSVPLDLKTDFSTPKHYFSIFWQLTIWFYIYSIIFFWRYRNY